MSNSAFSQQAVPVPVTVANGGTGASSLTGVLIGNGTSAVTTKTNPTGAFLGTTDSQAVSNKTETLAAGSTSVAPLIFTSGTNLTTPTAGAMEFDGIVPTFTSVASSRQVLDAEQFIILTSSYTLTSQTAAQKIFNATTNGTITLASNTLYQFECLFTVTNLSITSGSFGFALGGTATIASQLWWAGAVKAAAVNTPNAQFFTYNTTSANTAISASNANTVAGATVRGTVTITTAGTLIPQISLGTAIAAVIGVGSYFRIWPVGSNTVTNVGNWS